jgi:hypothetical protein
MKLHKAPFAVTSDGTVLVNVGEFDGVETVEDAVTLTKGAQVFIGVPLTGTEVRRLLEQLGHGHREAAAHLIGARPRRSRRQRKA